MKISWLNDNLTEARVERGWFQRMAANVRWQPIDAVWVFADVYEALPWWIGLRLEWAQWIEQRRRQRRGRRLGWKPIARLPRAIAKKAEDRREDNL